MTFKTIALAAALFALPLGISASISGGTAFAATVGGGGGGGNTGGGGPGGNSGSEGGNSEPSSPAGLCVPASSYSLAEARRHMNDGCPKTITIQIGSLRLI
jgi:hypothetical protein